MVFSVIFSKVISQLKFATLLPMLGLGIMVIKSEELLLLGARTNAQESTRPSLLENILNLLEGRQATSNDVLKQPGAVIGKFATMRYLSTSPSLRITGDLTSTPNSSYKSI